MRFVTPEVERFVAENAALGSHPVEIIRAKTAALHEEYRDRFGFDLPLDLELLALLRTIKVVREPLPEDVSGELIPASGGLLARINSRHTAGRQNFSIGHEIAHTFFPGYREVEYRRERSVYWTPGNVRNFEGVNGEVELLCDIGASELLMPRAEFRQEMVHRDLSVGAILELAARFGASHEAVSIRMMRETDQPAAVVFCHNALKPAEIRAVERLQDQVSLFEPASEPEPELKPEPKLRVRRSYCSENFRGFIPPHCLVPAANPFHRALGLPEQAIVEGEGLVSFGSGNYFSLKLRYGIVLLGAAEAGPFEGAVMGLLVDERKAAVSLPPES